MSGPAELHPLQSADGTPLRYRVWRPAAPRATMVAVHGLGEHSGRYADLALRLTGEGVAVFAPDLRGHGVSGGRRGHIDGFEDYLADVDAMLAEAVAATAPVPLVLFGHSLGGLVALRYAETRADAPVAGLVLSSPAIRPLAIPSPRGHRLLGILAAVLPALPLGNRVDPEDLSHDPAEVAAYREDPLVHDTVTPRAYREIVGAGARAQAETGRVRVPHVLVIVPGADPVIDPGPTLETAAELARVVDVEVRGYSGFYHESFHEVDRSRVMDDLTRWLAARIG